MNNYGYITLHNVCGHDFETITFYYMCKEHFRAEVAKMFYEAKESTEDFTTHLATSNAQPTHFKSLMADHCDGDYHVHFFLDTGSVILNGRDREFPLVDLTTFIERFYKLDESVEEKNKVKPRELIALLDQ